MNQELQLHREPMVPFTVTLAQGVAPKSIECRLHDIAIDMAVRTVMYKRLAIGLLEGITSRSTYENLFGAQLDYRSGVWHELKSAAVPHEFREEIVGVSVSTL
jgi:hypothetical protein